MTLRDEMPEGVKSGDLDGRRIVLPRSIYSSPWVYDFSFGINY
jgi:hypothetical protein